MANSNLLTELIIRIHFCAKLRTSWVANPTWGDQSSRHQTQPGLQLHSIKHPQKYQQLPLQCISFAFTWVFRRFPLILANMIRSSPGGASCIQPLGLREVVTPNTKQKQELQRSVRLSFYWHCNILVCRARHGCWSRYEAGSLYSHRHWGQGHPDHARESFE